MTQTGQSNNKIGWTKAPNLLAEHPVCEAPVHQGMDLQAVVVMALSEGGAEPQVWGACALCLQAIADDLGTSIEEGVIL